MFRSRFLIKIIVAFVLFGCSYDDDINPSTTTPESDYLDEEIQIDQRKEITERIQELQSAIVLKGDSVAYAELWGYYFDNKDVDFLPWALIMANKYDYCPAYFGVFNCYVELNCEVFTGDNFNDCCSKYSLDNLDEITQCTALDYLERAAQMGHEEAIEILEGYELSGQYKEQLARTILKF